MRMRVFRSIASELMGLPEDHPAVTEGCLLVSGPFVMLLVYDRRHAASDISSSSALPPRTLRRLPGTWSSLSWWLAALAKTVESPRSS